MVCGTLCSVDTSSLSPGKVRQMNRLRTGTNSLGWLLYLDHPRRSSWPTRVLEFFNEDRSAKGEFPNETLESVLTSSLERVEKTMESEAFLAFIRLKRPEDDLIDTIASFPC